MTGNEETIDIESVREASRRIAGYVRQSPLVAMTPTGILLKAESLHPVGAFKIRGAFNALLSMHDRDRRHGVVAHSSGNHAQAVAYAAHVLGMPCAVVMPDNAPVVKISATRRWGAEIHLVPPSERVAACQTLGRARGAAIIEPFDSPAIMAGTGTIALEILEQQPAVQAVLAPVSGGGLLGGIAAAAKQSRASVRIIGVEPEMADDAAQSFRAGARVAISSADAQRTMADGLRVPQLGALPWANIRAFVDDIVTVSEDEIRRAMCLIASEARLVAEPSGAVALAGALKLGCPAETTVAILSGGNVDPALYAAVIGGSE